MELCVGYDDFLLVPSVGVSTWGPRMSSGPALLVGGVEGYTGPLVWQCRHADRRNEQEVIIANTEFHIATA
jgi:hypothetical protein